MKRGHMNRKLVIVSLLVLPLLVLFATSCGGQSQTSDQQPPQLSPENQARQTVTQFLEMCKQGQVQEAIETYTDHAMLEGQSPDFNIVEATSKLFEQVTGYNVVDAARDDSSDPPAIWVHVEITSSLDGKPTTISLSFMCSLDGTQIIHSTSTGPMMTKGDPTMG
jgi:hypothetical protein